MARDTPVNGTALSATTTVTVNIEHVNEFAPQFNETDFRAFVPEGSPPGYPVFNVQVSLTTLTLFHKIIVRS